MRDRPPFHIRVLSAALAVFILMAEMIVIEASFPRFFVRHRPQVASTAGPAVVPSVVSDQPAGGHKASHPWTLDVFVFAVCLLNSAFLGGAIVERAFWRRAPDKFKF